MALSSRRAAAALRRTTNRQCGLLSASANLTAPRPVYHEQQCRHKTTSIEEQEILDGVAELMERKRRRQPPPNPADARVADRARAQLGLKPSDEVGLPTPSELLSWPKSQEDTDTKIPPAFYDLPHKARRALNTKTLPSEPITADNLFSKLGMSDRELDILAKTGRTRHDPKYKSHGLVTLKPSDLTDEDVAGMADLSDINTLIGNFGFSESEIASIMRDENEPVNEIVFMKRIIEETEKDMKSDLLRLRQHEEAMLKEEISLRIAQGLTPEEAEHDARAVMRLPQIRTETRQAISRDLSDEAIDALDTLSNPELQEMGEKGLRTMMKKMDHRAEFESRPLRPSKHRAQEMFYLPPPKFEDDDQHDPDLHEWNSTDMSSIAHDELQEHREARHYARLAVYDMPRLSKYVKPFKVPAASQVLRFRYTTHMGVDHPTDKKVVMEVCPDDLGLTRVQTDKLIKLCGVRYNPTKKLLKFSCEMFEHQHQNKRWLSELMDKLVAEAKDDTDTFEDVPFDFRHHTYKEQPSFPKEWRMTKEKLALKRLKDWQKNATPYQWDRLKTYIHYQVQERKMLEMAKVKDERNKIEEDGIDLSVLETEVPVQVLRT